MVVHRRLTLKAPTFPSNGPVGLGRVEITVSHNALEGSEFEAEEAWRIIRDAIIARQRDLTIEVGS
jgi:hypothetical protein